MVAEAQAPASYDLSQCLASGSEDYKYVWLFNIGPIFYQPMTVWKKVIQIT